MLEMMISVAIMATMASILFPMASHHYRQGLMTQYRTQAEYFLKQARILAMEKGRNVSFCQQNDAQQQGLQMRLRGSTDTTVCSGVAYRTLNIPNQDNLFLVTNMSNSGDYYDPRGKFIGAGKTLCIHNRRNYIRFTLNAYSLREDRGAGACP